jgi:hypothetical protein
VVALVVEGNTVACQTWIEGTFAREFTQSPAGPLPPNGKRVVFDLINIFRFDDQRRVVEEWVRTDYRSFLRQLGAPHRPVVFTILWDADRGPAELGGGSLSARGRG